MPTYPPLKRISFLLMDTEQVAALNALHALRDKQQKSLEQRARPGRCMQAILRDTPAQDSTEPPVHVQIRLGQEAIAHALWELRAFIDGLRGLEETPVETPGESRPLTSGLIDVLRETGPALHTKADVLQDMVLEMKDLLGLPR